MRTFIAIEIPADIRQQLAGLQRRLRDTGVEAGWPRPEGIHLTLKFLGEVPADLIEQIKHGLEEAVREVRRFRIGISGSGAFPNVRNARVVWAGLAGDLEALARLQAGVEDAMAVIGIERETRPFKPHLTLGRIKSVRSKDAWLKTLEELKSLALPGFEVHAVSLMKSELKRTGAEYTELARVELL